MVIQHNIMAMNAYRNYAANTSALASNLEKLSSGYKINRAGDDAAGLAISEKMRAQITGLEAAEKNVSDGVSLVKTAEGAMQEIQDMLNRMGHLATQSANGTYDNEVDRANLQKEVDALKTEINRIADSANFNGINLLDGSMSANSVATSIEVAGNATSVKSAAVKGVWDMDGNIATAVTDSDTGLDSAFGNSIEFTVSLNNGKSYTAALTLQEKEGASGTYELVAADGTTYEYAAGSEAANTYSAIQQELNKTSLADDFDIKNNGDGTFTFTALQEGTANPEVAAIDVVVKDSTGAVKDDGDNNGKIGVVTTTQPLDEGREIANTAITEYDGTNYDDAVFTINGKKFVLMTETMNGTTTGTANSEFMRAVAALGSDVTVLVGGQAGLTTADGNFAQNCKAIQDATGLTVGDAIATDSNAVSAGGGIRLSIGKNTTDKSLTLQIGDTADDYNQMKVGINDMHCDALGIADLDISTQEGAKDAITVIKNAINSVSSTRGDLGAIQNRLEHTANNLSVMVENITDAESSIRDTDVAEEMMSYTKNNILVQSAQAMLAQANAVPQGVLQLLQ